MELVDLAESAEPAVAVPVELRNYWPLYSEGKVRVDAAVAAAGIAVEPVAVPAVPAAAPMEF